MSHWTQPPDPQELQELARESRPAEAFDRRWYGVAFLAGILMVCILGFGTDLFDSGPSESDVSSAYRSGVDQGVASAEAFWEDELVDRWWEGYKRGQASETSMAPVILKAMRDGFSWEAGFEAGLDSEDVDIDASYREGWMQGYRDAWTRVTGVSSGARFVPHPPGPGYASRVRWQEGGGEP